MKDLQEVFYGYNYISNESQEGDSKQMAVLFMKLEKQVRYCALEYIAMPPIFAYSSLVTDEVKKSTQ